MKAHYETLVIQGILIALLLNAYSARGGQPPPTPATTLSTATPTAKAPPAPVVSYRLEGVWHRYSKADGFCTDSPVFIGANFIGTGTTTVCAYGSQVHPRWASLVVPQGTRVTAANRFAPGGGLEAATDAGPCILDDTEKWRCNTPADGFRYHEVRAIEPLSTEPVYMLKDAIAVGEKKTIYNLPNIVQAANAMPTRIAVSHEFGEGSLPRQIWVGTNNSGIVVINPDTGNSIRYTINDGLPSNLIRDVCTETISCPKFCNFNDVWVATDKGIAHWDGSAWSTHTTANGLPSNDVRGVSSRERNTVWAATAKGAAYFDGTAWLVFNHDNGLPQGDLTGVLCWGNEAIFTTRNNGLLVFAIGEKTQVRPPKKDTPPVSHAERKAILDTLRKRWPNEDVVFVVKYLNVSKGWAWIHVVPQSRDGRSQFENEAWLLQQVNNQWKEVESRGSGSECEEDPDCSEDTRYFKNLKSKYPSAPASIFPY